MSTIDWPNIAATLASAFIGGLIAAGVAGRQIKASHSAERDKTRRECARDLIESIDSFLHIAYRSETPRLAPGTPTTAAAHSFLACDVPA